MRILLRGLLATLLVLAGTRAALADAAEKSPPAPGFQAEASSTEFRFATDLIEGVLRTDGAYHGVTRLTDKRTGRQVIDPRYSALNLFKLMSVNQAMDLPRTMARTVEVKDGVVEIHWPASEGYQGEVTARYELCPPNAIDLTVTVKSRGTYPGCEVFLSNYFDKAMRPHVMLQARGKQPPEWVLPTVNDAFRGTVLVFARDPLAARFCVDGRWNRNERKTPVVQMCPVRYYAQCVAVQEDPQSGLAAVLMSHPGCCYAISTRYHADDDADRLTTYSAFDLSLFGADFVPGMQRRAKVRLALLPCNGDFDVMDKAYREFLAATDAEFTPAGGPVVQGAQP